MRHSDSILAGAAARPSAGRRGNGSRPAARRVDGGRGPRTRRSARRPPSVARADARGGAVSRGEPGRLQVARIRGGGPRSLRRNRVVRPAPQLNLLRRPRFSRLLTVYERQLGGASRRGVKTDMAGVLSGRTNSASSTAPSNQTPSARTAGTNPRHRAAPSAAKVHPFHAEQSAGRGSNCTLHHAYIAKRAHRGRSNAGASCRS